jgi:hypothetical protein
LPNLYRAQRLIGDRHSSLARSRYEGEYDKPSSKKLQGGSNMTGTNCDLFTYNQSRSYLNHLVLTPWSRVLLEKLTGPYTVKRFNDFIGTDRSTPCCQEAGCCYYHEPDKSTPYSPSYVFKIHLNAVFLSRPRSFARLSPPVFSIKPSIVHHMRVTCTADLLLLHVTILIIFREEFKT